MGDFFVDDQLYDHPKAHAAGDDAVNLYVRGLAWAHRHNTGLIPKPAVPTLTTKNTKGLPEKLVAAGLWHDEGASYRIHDWTTRNAKSIARREAGRIGAKAKWAKFYESQKNGSAIAEESQSDRSEIAMRNPANPLPNQPRNQGTKEPDGVIAIQQQQACTAERTAAAAELITETFEILFARRGPSRSNPPAHRYVVFKALAEQHEAALAALDWDTPWTAQMLADWLEPTPSKPQLAVVREHAIRCEVCNDRPNAYDIDERGNAIPCPACKPSEETA